MPNERRSKEGDFNLASATMAAKDSVTGRETGRKRAVSRLVFKDSVSSTKLPTSSPQTANWQAVRGNENRAMCVSGR